MFKKRKFKKKRGNFASKVRKVMYKTLETKQTSLSFNATAIQDPGRTPITANLAVDQGDTQNTRTGNSIMLTGLIFNYQIIAADTTNIVRILLYIPHDVDFVHSVNTYQLTDQDTSTTLAERFVVVSTQAGPNIKRGQIKLSFTRNGRKGIAMKYSGASSSDLAKNCIKLYVVSDSGAINDPTLSGNLRLYYKDA